MVKPTSAELLRYIQANGYRLVLGLRDGHDDEALYIHPEPPPEILEQLRARSGDLFAVLKEHSVASGGAGCAERILGIGNALPLPALPPKPTSKRSPRVTYERKA